MRPDSFWEGGAPLPFTAARWSGLSAGVPGTVRGWEMALSEFGAMSLAEVLRPAIAIAREGFVVDEVFSSQIEANLDFFDDITSTRAVYLEADGTAPAWPKDRAPSASFCSPALAFQHERRR